MNFLPFEKITFQSSLSKQFMLDRIQHLVETNPLVIHGMEKSEVEKKFKGKLTRKGFEIERFLKKKNPFTPKIIGNIDNEFLSSTVHVKLQLDAGVTAFLLIWLAAVVFNQIITLTHLFYSYNLLKYTIIPFGIFAIIYFVVLTIFKRQCEKAKSDLVDLLNADIVNSVKNL